MRKKIMMSICAVAAAAFPAGAETVAWYHFDEALPGTRTTGDSVIVNSVNPQAGAGLVRTWRQNSHRKPYIETVEEYMPVYTNALEDCVRVFDPVSGSVLTSTGSLHFCSADATQSGSTASCLSIADHEDFHSQSLTIEFLLKLPAFSHQTQRFILDKGFPFDTFGTSLPALFRIVLSGKVLQATLKPTTESTTVTACSGTTVADGNWHHVAIVVDGEKKQFSLFVDGKTVDVNPGQGRYASVSYEGELDFTGGTPITFGPYASHYYGSFEGEVDEIRISDEALTPDRFLSFRIPAPVSPLTGADTLFYTPFAGSTQKLETELKYGGGKMSYVPALLNRAARRADYPVDTMVVAERANHDPESYAIVSDVPYGSLVRDCLSVRAVENLSSYRTGLTQDGGMPTALLVKDGYALLSDSFTIEFFGNMAVGEPSSEETRFAYLVSHNNLYTLWCNNDGKLSMVLYGGAQKMLFDGVDKSQKAYNDGKWHHYAIVYDKTGSTMALYLDKVRIGILENVNIDTARAASNANSDLVFFGYHVNYVYGPRDFMMDELRITRGALAADRFLCRERKGLSISVQ